MASRLRKVRLRLPGRRLKPTQPQLPCLRNEVIAVERQGSVLSRCLRLRTITCGIAVRQFGGLSGFQLDSACCYALSHAKPITLSVSASANSASVPVLQVCVVVPVHCPRCTTSAWADLHRNHRGMTIALEWHCTFCQHRWPVTLREVEERPATQPG